MTRKTISDAVSGIDNRYIEEVMDFQFTKNQLTWIKRSVIASCLCLIVFGALTMELLGKNIESTIMNDGTTILFSKTEANASALELNARGRVLTTDEIKAIFGEIPISGIALFALDDESFIGIDGHYGDMKLVISMLGNCLLDTVVVGEAKTSTVRDIPVNAGVFITKANSQGVKTAIYYAQIKFNDYSIYVENAGVESDRENIRAALVSAIEELTASHFDFSTIH